MVDDESTESRRRRTATTEPILTVRAGRAPLVFVSYPRVDRERVTVLVKLLAKDLEYAVWYDRKLYAGQETWDAICDQIRRCELFVYVVSAGSRASEWCDGELAYALALKRQVMAVRLDPKDHTPPPKSIDAVTVIGTDSGSFDLEVARSAEWNLVQARSRPRPDPLPTPTAPAISVPELYATAHEDQLSDADQQNFALVIERLERQGRYPADVERLAGIMVKRQDVLDEVAGRLKPLGPPRLRRAALWAGGTVVALLIAIGAGVRIIGQIPGGPSRVCPTLPAATVFVGDDGQCHGFTDGAASLAGFSDVKDLRDKQATIFEKNRTDLGDGPLTSDDLTVVWFGSMATNGKRGYGSQLQQLQALQLAQLRWPGGADAPHVRVHVVVADAGADMMYAERVAGLLVKARPSFGGRVVVVGGGDSRATTEKAINSLLDNRIPFIAPTLTADWSRPGRPFIDRPGYLQLAAANVTQAQAMVDLVARYTPQGSVRKVLIYTEENPDLPRGRSKPEDLYMASLARAVRDAATKGSRTQPAPSFVNDPSSLADDVCRDPSRRRRGGVDSAAVVFAARAKDFLDLDVKAGHDYDDFAHTIHTLCEKKGGPALVIADDAATRVMLDDSDRGRAALSFATWPMAFVAKGDQCDALEGARSRSPEAAALLELAGTTLNECIAVPSPDGQGTTVDQLGVSVSPTWDAVALADAVLPRSDALPALADLATQHPFAGTSTTYDVQDGQITVWRSLDVPTTLKTALPQDTPMRLYCVHSVGLVDGDQGRAVRFCDEAFRGLTGAG